MQKISGQSRRIVWTLAIAIVSAVLGILVDSRAPGIGRYARDWLTQERGALPAPDDIAIVAIDEPSLARFGRFPWSRQVMVRTIDALSAAQPKAIALDILFVDPTTQDDDDALAGAIGKAGNVVVAAQLTESAVHGGPSEWLRPLPPIANAAAAIGHVNVQTESDGVARQIEVRASDDAGHTIRAMAVEAVRIADGTPDAGVTNTRRALLVGARTIPLDVSQPPVVIGQAGSGANGTQILRGGRMTIDYIGPAGSFGPNTYSLADVVEGRVPGTKFRDKYVLIGATAASQGDRLSSPFVHQTDAHADQHGSLMPGVEVLANAVNTILRSRFYSDTSGWAAFFWSALIALATLAVLEVAQGGTESLKQLAGLAGIALAIVAVSYLVFTRLLVFPPLVPGLVACASAGILGLLHRSISASRRLDENLAELAESSDLLGPAQPALEGKHPPHAWAPHGLEWKARTLAELNARLLARAKFVDFAMRSVEDGLIIASPDGSITFANRSAAAILGSTPPALVGQSLLARLLDAPERDLLARLVVDRVHIEREVTFRDVRANHYMLRMGAVTGGENGDGPVLGIVASLSDVTRQHELQQTKNDVISLVSHEMRTPLTAIQGMTELLADYEVDPARRREMHLAINDEVKRLTRMISEYLDITRLESGATEVRLAPVRIENLVERILLLLDPVAARREIRLVRKFAPGLPPLLADPDLLSRTVENLISNAIKYSPEGTAVTISADRDASMVRIDVSDQGYGISEHDLTRIFEKFFRVPRVQDAGVPGTGLGLALVREIAELHGGSVTVKSELGTGSTFSLRIPHGGAE
ncbi:MAG TPA: CHASE2 domain-containing protein [Bryobacteraceae bacterium]|nr:CHASE2 domain-containing protein [Bryobacteraceae bacterium]